LLGIEQIEGAPIERYGSMEFIGRLGLRLKAHGDLDEHLDLVGGSSLLCVDCGKGSGQQLVRSTPHHATSSRGATHP